MRKLLLLFVGLLLCTAVFAHRPVKVACVGNSITYGYGIADRETNSYPAQLQRMLGDGSLVGNFGKSGATLLRRGHRPALQPADGVVGNAGDLGKLQGVGALLCAQGAPGGGHAYPL